ncbi:UDP-4-amino-4-deoxy-L-arabinose--oxoglutarate aminotransferase [Methanobrevibacter cuticularis]|uniref:UDP-4-amino-4-deoxy-L-arabinose--oxoglutarate aminotransferase n=1 Tax=Methanobrevibacter cuticularis TaxID=47311 RepID=A0A166CMF3_9EURY|nr:DegT/DnrJ/EryC1/StrS family aminotransferase [Methanobrevibacter cuticularis]KZX14663.1 UDP-4-amino-4-deoxy-L-arabinose--oxoglutarate aminotransferase [Methanobrevibacter cuticularis]
MIIQVGDLKIGDYEKKVINEILDSGRISEGINVKSFEIEWAKFIGTDYSLTTSSGTAALITGLSSLKYLKDTNISNNSKVITTPLTYISTINAISLSNFDPIFVDIDMDTLGITAKNIEDHLETVEDITNYSLILPVHLMGFSVDMNKINKIAKKYGLNVVEDSAQAHGTEYKNKKTGSMSLFSIFSFYIAHNIQVGEMGAINTNNKELMEICRKMKSNGRMCSCAICTRNTGSCPVKFKENFNNKDPRFTHDIIGYNFKTMEFQAALALAQLRNVDSIIKQRNENVKYLNEGLNEFENIIKLPNYSSKTSYLAYPIIVSKPEIISREKIRKKLENKGIETRPLFGSIPTQQPAYSHLKNEYSNKLPNADFVGKNGFYIGCHQYLGTEELDYIIKTFKELFH